MPICMGVLCDRCRTVYFIPRSGKSARIHFDHIRGEFKLMCDPPCNRVTLFHRPMFRPYSVSAEMLEQGYANIGECHPVSEVAASANSEHSKVCLAIPSAFEPH